MTSLVFGVLAKEGQNANSCQAQENKTRDLQPELTEGAPEMGCGSADSLGDGGESARPTDLLAGDAGRDPEFARCGNIRHGLQLIKLILASFGVQYRGREPGVAKHQAAWLHL